MRPTVLPRCLPDFRRLTSYFLVTFILLGAVSCKAAPQPPEQKKFGSDADYFIGLRLLEEGNEKAARAKFKSCIKNGSQHCAQKSAEILCTLGNIQEKNAAAENLLKQFPGEDSILIAARQFSASGEINRLIECTSGLDFATAKNEIIRLRLEAMGHRGDSAYEAEVYRWFTECPISTEHYQFYRDTYKHPDFEGAYENPDEEITLEYSPEQFVINYRIESYKRNYTYTLKYTEELLNYFREGKIKPVPQIVSDTGKNLLYGSQNYQKNGTTFYQLASEFSGTPAEFYFWFYAARLFDKTGMFSSRVMNCFEGAVRCANTPSEKDNALWYLLKLYTTIPSQNGTIDPIIFSIKEYAEQWSDPEYFEDFFEGLIPSLLASGRWESFGEIYHIIDGYASDLTTAQFAYIYGRLIQEGLANGTDEDAMQAFKRACKGGSSVYYKTLAAYRLGLWKNPAELQKILCAPTFPKESDAENSFTPDTALETLLLGYASFGFPDLIYPEWQKTQGQNISSEVNFYLADFLAKCADSDNNDFYVQSLRIAARAQRNAKEEISPEQLSLVYPSFYKEFVEHYCNEYQISDPVIYALIRSESFFDADVLSSAGAVGLTQLMEFTASDIARRFKMADYSLTDPETNIRFGTWYLASLISRFENSPLLGFFSYNAGPTRVRRWLQSSLTEFGKKSNMPLDLFLETVPYAETREYGRKLISATIAYDWLEDPSRFPQTVEELLK